jgi:hypothetical protein
MATHLWDWKQMKGKRRLSKNGIPMLCLLCSLLPYIALDVDLLQTQTCWSKFKTHCRYTYQTAQSNYTTIYSIKYSWHWKML